MATSSKAKITPKRSSALMRAERGSKPVHLTSAESKLLERALAAGQDLSDALEAAVVKFGRWLVVEVFDGDGSAALDGRSQNPVWLELVRRAGGPTLGVSRRMLYVAVAIAANDHRITDQSWQRLDVQRKEILLPLREPALLREGAQHVSKFNLSQQQTHEFVSEQMAKQGKSRQVRLTRSGMLSRMKTLRSGFGSAALRRVEELAHEMTGPQRAEMLREAEASIATLQQVITRLRKA